MKNGEVDNAKFKLKIEDRLYSAYKNWANRKSLVNSLDNKFWQTQGQFLEDFQKKLSEFNNVLAELGPLLVEGQLEDGGSISKETHKDLLSEKDAERFKQLLVKLDEKASNLCDLFIQNREFIRKFMLEYEEKLGVNPITLAREIQNSPS